MNRWARISLLFFGFPLASACGGSSAKEPRDVTTVRMISNDGAASQTRVFQSDAEARVRSSAQALSVANMQPASSPAAAPRRVPRFQLQSADVPVTPLTEWSGTYPVASQELGAWIQKWPNAASRLFALDQSHTGAVETFTLWATTHPNETLGSFLLTRRGWYSLAEMRGRDATALDEYMAWARRSPDGAFALVKHPGGLAWAATNLYGVGATRQAAR